MKIAISSFKFSPGHLSHIIAYAKLFKELGYETLIWLDKNYKLILPDDLYNLFPVRWYSQYRLLQDHIDFIFIVNVSTVNHLICKELKKKDTKIIYLYHEPWDNLKQYLKEGLKQSLKTFIAHYFSVKTLRCSDLVIVPSNYALNLYRKKDIHFNRNVIVIPLLFDDETDGKIDFSKKEYFSYIGHAVKGHAFDLYVDLIKYMYKRGVEIKFEIATRVDLSRLLNKDNILQKMLREKVLRVSHERPLKNTEINRAYERSFCVWNIYRRSTQSGVLPKAFMFGTPVIASNIGSFGEFIKNGYNGVLIDNKNMYDLDVIYKNVLHIKRNLLSFSKNARRTFLEVFHWKNWVSKFEDVLFKIYSVGG